MIVPSGKDFLTAAEVRAALRCSGRTVRRLLDRGALTAKRVNKRRFLYHRSTVLEFLRSLPDARDSHQ